MGVSSSSAEVDSPRLAVIGMAGRFPGARSVDSFWSNLTKGEESIARFPDATTNGEAHVPALGLLEGADEFDAAFFGYSPLDALILDPQHRLFLECAWEALEAAGYDVRSYSGAIGVYAGCSQTSYLDTLLAHRDRVGPVSEWQLRLATGIDFLTSRVAHKLGLTGPAVTVQTACSTSLVAIHVAAQALISGECDMALAGGATVHVPMRHTEYVEGGVISPDGHCRAFDAGGQGTVGADGVGIVVLKRLADALADGDHIHAVVRGTATNNDGRNKVGFTAPSVAGQAEVIRYAHLVADVDPASIGYVETHGTGTRLGDPIEIAALTQAFRDGTDERGFCRIGSVKTNIGHTDAAAGVAGFIKAVLAVEHGLIPASLHFSTPNPDIPFDSSPFTVNTALYEWRPKDRTRIAGVSSFGIGGTNAHAVLEEPPAPPPASADTRPQLLVMSARTHHGLSTAALRLGEHLQHRDDRSLADVAWTLQAGRSAFEHRRFAVVVDRTDAVEQLTTLEDAVTYQAVENRPVTFLFPGQGGQYVGMGRELYDHEPVFREHVDMCSRLLMPHLDVDMRSVLYPTSEREADVAREALRDICVGQPAVFVVEYALAQMWQHWGIRPSAVAGHSLGAFAAACIADVISLPDALRLVTERGKLLRTLPPGAMLMAPLPEHEIRNLLNDDLELAAVNGPHQCVVAGPEASVEALMGKLDAAGIDAKRLRIAAAGHSAQVEPILADFAARVAEIDLAPPRLPWAGDTTGDWVPMGQAPTADFWTTHMRAPVRFGDTLTTLLAESDQILLEVGPGRTLSALARRHPAYRDSHLTLPTLPHPSDEASALQTALSAAGRLWAAGHELTWSHMHGHERRHRVPLPTYPFNRGRYSPLPQADVLAEIPAAVVAAPPRTDQLQAGSENVQDRLAELFGRLLGIGEVSTKDNFFDLGGDSLIAVQLAAAVRATFGVQITARQVFTAPTPARLGLLVEKDLAHSRVTDQ